MEFEYWWLLVLPLFFSLGWLAARIDIKHVLSESRRLPASYFQGLNFLLNEQTDKAIEAFNRAIEEKGTRSDGALYWRAYSENKLGKSKEALATSNGADVTRDHEPKDAAGRCALAFKETLRLTGPVDDHVR